MTTDKLTNSNFLVQEVSTLVNIAVVGKYAEAIIYTELIEVEAMNQIIKFVNSVAAKGTRPRIMPDVHSGAGCVIGFTTPLAEYIVPNMVGVDIGCGVMCFKCTKPLPDFKRLDDSIRDLIPFGRSVNSVSRYKLPLEVQVVCEMTNQDPDYVSRSMCSLGGGNHFIEVNDFDDNHFLLTVHSGSRNFGKKIADFWQKIAEKKCKDKARLSKEELEEIRETFPSYKIGDEIKRRVSERKIDKELSYLEGMDKEDYLHHMYVAQDFAHRNRKMILETLVNANNLTVVQEFESVHNYISPSDRILRKGAISAQKAEIVIIPLNMKDGLILGRGKGNKDWNFSAPHGAGRKMSRSQAKKELSLDEFIEEMKDIWTTSVSETTLDEAPSAYKDVDEKFLNYLRETIIIEKFCKPLYNFKA